jgi:hypothetical protein
MRKVLVNPILASQTHTLAEELNTLVETNYKYWWLNYNVSHNPPLSSKNSDILSTGTTEENLSINKEILDQTFKAYTNNHATFPEKWISLFLDLQKATKKEIEEHYKANVQIVADIVPFAIQLVQSTLERLDADVESIGMFVDYFKGFPPYNHTDNTMFILSDDATSELEVQLNDLLDVLSEYTSTSFYSIWLQSNWKAGVSTLPIVPFINADLIAKATELKHQKDFIKAKGFLNAPGGWTEVLTLCESQIAKTAEDYHKPIIGSKTPPDITDIKAYSRIEAKKVLDTLLLDKKYDSMFARYFSKHYNKTTLALLAKTHSNVKTYPININKPSEKAYSYWSPHASLAFDTGPFKAVLDSFQSVIEKSTTDVIQTTEVRKKVLDQISNWYTSKIADPVKKELNTNAKLMQEYSKAFDVTKYGVEVKAIVGSPVTGVNNLTSSVASSLSALRDQAPVFAHEADAYSSCLALFIFSGDISSSVILSISVILLIFGFKHEEIPKIIESLSQPVFSNIYPQINELIQAGSAFPSEITQLMQDAGLTSADLANGPEGVLKAWTANVLAPFTSLASDISTIISDTSKVVTSGIDKIDDIYTTAMRTNDNPLSAALSGKNLGFVAEELFPAFNQWFSVFSLATLLGPFNAALTATAESIASVFSEASTIDNLLSTVIDQPTHFIQRIGNIGDDIQKLNDTKTKILKGAENLLISAVSGVTTPQFGILAVPVVKGGSERLRFILNDMILNDKGRPKELDSPLGLIIPILLVGSTTIGTVDINGKLPIDHFFDLASSMFKVSKVAPTIIQPTQ